MFKKETNKIIIKIIIKIFFKEKVHSVLKALGFACH